MVYTYKQIFEGSSVLLWLLVVIGCSYCLGEYANRPGASGAALVETVEAVGVAGRSKGKPSLIVFIHPHCFCSWATFRQLETVLNETNDIDLPVVEIYVFVPVEEPRGDWMNSKLVRAFAGLPNAILTKDSGGRFALNYGSLTSGSICFIDKDSKLKFSGGITSSRGHQGECSASETLKSVLGGDEVESDQARPPVFGCPLF